MNIKYKNTKGEFITYHQAYQLDEFYKLFYDNDVLIKEETYFDGSLNGICYYNINNDSHITMLDNYYISSNLEFCIIDLLSYNNGYRLESLSSYSDGNGTLTGRTNSLFNTNNELVGTEVFLNSDTTPKYQHTHKYYYDRTINPLTYLFEVKYDESNGSFKYFDFNQEHTDPVGQDSFALGDSAEDIKKLINITGIPQEFIDYYLDSAVIPDF